VPELVWLSSIMTADLIITVSILYGLLRSKTGWAHTDKIVTKLIRMTVSAARRLFSCAYNLVPLRLRREPIGLRRICRAFVDLIDLVQIESQVPPLCIAIGVSQQSWYSSLSPRHHLRHRHCQRVLIRL
jgi:hypothetical protein